jgi:hypothetical protein
MRFLVDSKNKVIFGWNAKCGCSHIKTIYLFLQNQENHSIHTIWNDALPIDIETYTTIIISRNPYKRIISGFLEKYRKDGNFRHLYTHNTLTFSKFVNELIQNDWKMIEKHHFTPQTTEHFTTKILHSKCIKFYDIENIDYAYIETLYHTKIPNRVLNKKQGHEMTIKSDTFTGNAYDLNIDNYSNYNINFKQFYNKELKYKIFKFYQNDFTFFKEHGIDYITTTF